MQTTLEQVVRDNVVVVAEKACSELEQMVEKRKAGIEDIQGELDQLLVEIQSMDERPQ